MNDKLVIREAEINDIPAIINLINELADYEKLTHMVNISEAGLRNSLFGADKFIEVYLAEYDDKIVGQALFFKNFSTFLGKPGIYLEDLVVKPEYRGKGIGKALLKKIIDLARERNYGRVEWAVLDWNKPAIEFYNSLGAELLDDWKIFRLTSENF